MFCGWFDVGFELVGGLLVFTVIVVCVDLMFLSFLLVTLREVLFAYCSGFKVFCLFCCFGLLVLAVVF